MERLWRSRLVDLETLRTLGLSLLPGLFWIVYLRSLSGGRVPPWWQWLIALAAGWVSAQLTLYTSEALQVDRLNAVPYIGLLVYFVLGVGLVEEGAKALCAVVGLKLFRFADEPVFALQLSGGVALGFATTENMLYAQNFGESVLVGRFVSSTLAHVLFGSVWGFALGVRWTRDKSSQRLERKTPWFSFVGLLGLSAVSHGLFDWFLVTDRAAFAILTMVVLWVGFREAVVGAYLRQEYQRELPFETSPCPHCSVLTRAEGRFCSFCGNSLLEDGEQSATVEENLTGSEAS